MDKINIWDLPINAHKNKFLLKYISNRNIDIEFSYKSFFKNAKVLRILVSNICNYIWLDQMSISRIALMVDEMNNNAIEHWSCEWDINKLRFKCENQDNKLLISIEAEDSWKGNRAKTALDMETLRAHQLKLWYKWHDSIRWRWLFMIIVNIVDRIYFKDSKNGGLIVWIKKIYDF